MEIPNDRERMLCIAVGAAYRCPRDEMATECPLKKQRELPLADRLDYVMSLDDSALERIALFHYSCSEGYY
jgi:hypothetical protein